MMMTMKSTQRALWTSARRCGRFNNIAETIGRTPVVKIQRMGPPGVDLYVKCESFNPMSSVKDRLALAILLDAERQGKLQSGSTVIEATSGNTGIALAMLCAQRGYRFVSTMGELFSTERRKMMRIFGANVILTPASEGGFGMVKKAADLATKHGWYSTRQFENEANPRYHCATTGAEILLDFADKPIDFFVTGYGTGGTFTGVASALKAANWPTRIALVEPELAPLVKSGIKQDRNADGTPAAPHPAFNSHIIQGWTPNFIPHVTQLGLDNVLSDIVLVSGEESMQVSRQLALQEGIFTGISGGGTLAAALKVAEGKAPGTRVLAMLPDTMERYLSTTLVADIDPGMSEAELEIGQSTPGHLAEL
eukprot:GHVU01210999.1.p1 GENE.GHVU01210999.1~~GHVU01210999.1.p1  ORF type:complete len:366 (-),score=42.28 GHVU01210999.1:3-1100(-)